MAQSAEVYIPDGGWGWVIVTCSFLIHMFVVGTMYSLSVLYVAWLDQFDSGKGATSWIISLAVAVMFGIGPIPGFLSKKIGNRAVVVVGSIVMSLGFFVSFFAMNVYYLVITIGVVAGTGAGCCYLPSVSMVAMYFTTKRSIAMGISASGLGAGAFFMAPFLNWIVDFYGWRGCMLILSGISLNMCVLGALMRPLEKAPRFRNCHMIKDTDVISIQESPTLPRKSLGMGDCGLSAEDLKKCEEKCEEMCRDRQVNSLIRTCRKPNIHVYCNLPAREMNPGMAPIAYNFPAHPVVVHHTDLPHKKGEKEELPLTTGPQSNCELFSVKTQSLDRYKHPSCLHEEKLLSLLNDQDFVEFDRSNLLGKTKGSSLEILNSLKHSSVHSKKLYKSEIELRPRTTDKAYKSLYPYPSLNGMQMMLSGSVSSLVFMDTAFKESSSKQSVYSRNTSSHLQQNLVSSSLLSLTNIEEAAAEDEEIQVQSCCNKVTASLQTYLKLLQNPTFLLFGISNFLTNLSFFMPVLYMVDRALDSGIEKSEAAMLISLYGAGNIFGKLFFGWLADRELLDRLFYYIACLTVCGVSTCVSPVCGSSHELHSVYAFVFGCFIGAYATLVPIVTVDLMGVSVVAEAFGLLLSFMGIATAFGTPVAGWIFDWTGSYTVSFILHGVFILVSAFMLIPLLVLKRSQKASK
ncbi:monocarboxylate transporter 9-like [Physella acuta]|uniref:monocarboxylate transporter 9-like n=1 Tax=Physella acuta TaxID=109671 RepID=UPI0027DDF6D1|nr:monocarboxylate transporter 9-like [Physella acuta]XP_059153125.1 monocarboxylate transporter 9-like [Physella acuta]